MQPPMVPIERLRPFIEAWVAENKSTYAAFSQAAGLEPSTVRKIMNGSMETTQKNGKKYRYEKKVVDFDTADKIITKGLSNPFLWHTHFKDLYTKIPLNDQDRRALASGTGAAA